MNRRHFLHTSAAASLAGPTLGAAKPTPLGKADSCIFLWLGGGMAQVDTFDPKRRGDPAERVAGSAYDAIDTAVPGVRVTEHLPQLADRMDRVTALRTVQHNIINEHAAAVNYLHLGRPPSGTVVYPSIGSIVSHQLGPGAERIPPYVLIGRPSLSRGPGFLGPRYGYLYLTDTSEGPAGLSAPPEIHAARARRREDLLATLREESRRGLPEDDPLARYDEVIAESLELSKGPFRKVFELDREPDSLRQAYGSEFGQRCLLARRLVESGVRFVEVLHNLNFTNGTGWDTHNAGQVNQHLLIRELDAAVGTLLDDLEQRNRLDRTLIVIASEFGRPIVFDSGGGRNHQASVFTQVLAGGGLDHRGAFGETDEDSKEALSDPLSVADFHATIHAALGIDWKKELYDGDRPVPVTDRGEPVREILG